MRDTHNKNGRFKFDDLHIFSHFVKSPLKPSMKADGNAKKTENDWDIENISRLYTASRFVSPCLLSVQLIRRVSLLPSYSRIRTLSTLITGDYNPRFLYRENSESNFLSGQKATLFSLICSS